jgi:hypothetical protein
MDDLLLVACGELAEGRWLALPALLQRLHVELGWPVAGGSWHHRERVHLACLHDVEEETFRDL